MLHILFRNSICQAATILLFFLLLLSNADSVHADSRVAILFRQDLSFHKKLTDDIKRIIAQQPGEFTIIEWPVDTAWDPDTLETFRMQNPDKLVVLGDLALSFSLALDTGIPGIYLLVTSQELVDKATATGAWIGSRPWVSPEIQMKTIRNVLPDVRRVGIVVTTETQVDTESLRQEAGYNDLQLNLSRVKNRREVLAELDRMFRESDALILEPDPNLLNEIVLHEALKLQQRYRKPLIVLSERFVQFGALMSISYSLEIRTAKTVAQFIGERKEGQPDDLGLSPFCCLQVFINSDVAKKIGASISTADTVDIQFISPGRREVP